MNFPTHLAAVLNGFNRPMQFVKVATPRPGPHEVLVRVRAIALNPYDRIVQTLGSLITPSLKFPAVLGSDVAGEVIAVGAACERIKVGNRIMGLALGVDRVGNRLVEGAFQEQVVLREDCCCRLPEAVTFAQGAVLPLALATAASGLFLKAQLGLDVPTGVADIHQHRQTEQASVIVWGGSTSVGSIAIQLARAAGYQVLSTASPHNHEYVLGLGASAVVDFRSDSAVDRLVEATQRTHLAGLLAIGVGSGTACLNIAARKAPRPKVAMASAPVPLDGAPIGPQGIWRLANLPRLAGGFASLAARARFRGIPTSSIWGTALVNDPLGKAIFVDFAEVGLVDGRLRPAPEPLITGSRLEDIPESMNTLRRGVSARKLVVQL